MNIFPYVGCLDFFGMMRSYFFATGGLMKPDILLLANSKRLRPIMLSAGIEIANSLLIRPSFGMNIFQIALNRVQFGVKMALPS